MGCFCLSGDAAAAGQEELHSKRQLAEKSVGLPVSVKAVAAARREGTEGEDGLIKAAGPVQLAGRRSAAEQPYPPEGLGWDEVAPCRASERGSLLGQPTPRRSTLAGTSFIKEPMPRCSTPDASLLGQPSPRWSMVGDGPWSAQSPTFLELLAAQGSQGSCTPRVSALPSRLGSAQVQAAEEGSGMGAADEGRGEEGSSWRLLSPTREGLAGQGESGWGSEALADDWGLGEAGFPPPARAELLPLAEPEETLMACVDCLDSTEDPGAAIRALHALRRLAVHHPHLLAPHLRELVQLLQGFVACEEAAVSVVASCLVVDLVTCFGEALCRHCGPDRAEPSSSLMLQLLDRASSAPRPLTATPGKMGRPSPAAQRRVQEEWAATLAGMADQALTCMIDYFSQQRITALLQPYTHFKQPSRIRSAASALLVMTVYHR